MKFSASIILSILSAPLAMTTGESCYYWDSEKYGVCSPQLTPPLNFPEY